MHCLAIITFTFLWLALIIKSRTFSNLIYNFDPMLNPAPTDHMLALLQELSDISAFHRFFAALAVIQSFYQLAKYLKAFGGSFQEVLIMLERSFNSSMSFLLVFITLLCGYSYFAFLVYGGRLGTCTTSIFDSISIQI
jgi:hypothetical protein